MYQGAIGFNHYIPDLLPCPCCGSEQVQYCSDNNNPMKDIAKCRRCKAQAPVKSWNKRPSKPL